LPSPRRSLQVFKELPLPPDLVKAATSSIVVPDEFRVVPEHLRGQKVENKLGAGIESTYWFATLTAAEKRSLVQASLNVLENCTSDPRDRWLQVLFAVAHAEQLGCPDAHQLALEWSRQGASWTGEPDFEIAWCSYKLKPGGITIGSLLRMASEAALDLSPWRDVALARFRGAAAIGSATAPSGTSNTDPYHFVIIDLDDIPPHRQWSVGTKLIEGEVGVLASKGGWGKTAYSNSVCCSAASGRDFLNLTIYGGPKRILYINSEDDTDEIRRRFIAAARYHKLTKDDVARIMIRGVDTPGHQTLTAGDENAPRINDEAFTALDAIITKAEPSIVILDPLGTFCPVGLNLNGLMGQVMLRLKRLAKKHRCAILIVHHTRKDGDLTNTDAIGGASAIVNQARVAIMVARMTEEEAKKFKGILSSEKWRYFRIVDAKTNLAPPAPDDQWYQLVSHELPNAADPYPKGDGIQVVDKADPAQLNASPVASSTDDAAKRAILKEAHSADPPFSPSSRGGSHRYIVPRVLDAVRQATGMHWPERDLIKHIECLVREMMSAGWLRVEDVKVAGNKRKGVVVDYPRTPWPDDFTDTELDHEITDALAADQTCNAEQPRQFVKSSSKSTERGRNEDIDARRSRGASNVPKGCGDLMGPSFDGAPEARRSCRPASPGCGPVSPDHLTTQPI
jgi:AAA domain/Primase C terminal 2 (PriCT-2)